LNSFAKTGRIRSEARTDFSEKAPGDEARRYL
jgi:hypothetical protein